MTFEEKKSLMVKMGLDEERAEFLLQMEREDLSMLPMIRLLRSINDYLKFREGGYAEYIKKCQAEGTLNKGIEAELIKKGVTPEEIQALAYNAAYDSFDVLLNLFVLPNVYESEMFKDEAFAECGRAGLMEIGPDGKPTGKRIIYPSGDMYLGGF